MNHKIGDRVRIRSKAWMDKQPKDSDGDIIYKKEHVMITLGMQKWAGIETTTINLDGEYYKLNGIPGSWNNMMFEPVHSPAGPLNPIEAVDRMLKGEAFYTEDGDRVFWHDTRKNFLFVKGGDNFRVTNPLFSGQFDKLYENHPLHRVPKKRDMTRWEALAWATSEISHGWVVTSVPETPADSDDWNPPQSFNYYGITTNYRRAMLKPDCTGVDESSIQTFEVVEE